MAKILCFPTIQDFKLFSSKATIGKRYYIEEIKDYVIVKERTYGDSIVYYSLEYSESLPTHVKEELNKPLYHDTLEHRQFNWSYKKEKQINKRS